MQEIKKRRIVIASVLKPVDDTRMFEKIAVSLSGMYAVHVIGFESGANEASTLAPSVWCHSLGRFNRLSMKRLFTPFRIFGIAFKIKPDLIIITTHELLCAALLLKLVTGCKIVYDIQENYAQNIYYGSTVPVFLRLPLSISVRVREWLVSIFVAHFLLSEKSYATELGFIRNRYSVLQNKLGVVPVLKKREPISSKKKITLLFSGTLTTTTGVFTAIELTAALNREDPRIHLCIIGYASQGVIRSRIKNAVADKPFVEVVGLDQLVEHRRILDKVRECDLGIIAYPPNPSTHTAFPTKLFEYLGYQLPILLIENKAWVDYCKAYDAAIVFDMSTLESKALLHDILTKQFFTKYPEDVFWRSQESALQSVVTDVLG
ncbi:MAG: hypothetical protein ABIS36_12595 [Chryseolinea sp.]